MSKQIDVTLPTPHFVRRCDAALPTPHFVRRCELFVILIMFLFFAVRLYGLGPDIANSDAGRWHRRSEKFLDALKKGDFAGTYQHYQPGVTLMWINAFVKQAAFSYQLTYTNTPQTLENADWFPIIHGLSKAAIVFVLGFLLTVQMYIIAKLFSEKASLLYGFFISTEPYLIGIDRWLHLTSLGTYFSITSFLSLLFWTKNKKTIWLFISSALYTLAVYSKLTELVILPLLIFIIVKEVIKDKDVKHILAFFVTFVLLGFAVFPAMWVQPFEILSKFLNAITNAVSEDIRGSYITGVFGVFYYTIVILFRMSPVFLILLLVSLAFIKPKKEGLALFGFLCHILTYLFLYYFSLTISDQKIDRYVVSMIPILILLAAIGLSRAGKAMQILAVSSSLAFFFWVFIKYQPLYTAYYSPLFGGTQSALSIGVYENSGEFFANAARYLNSKGRDIGVYVPNNIDSFSFFFKGRLQREYDQDTDFVVTSVDFDRKMPNFPQCPTLDTSFGIDKQVVYVYSCN